MKKRGFDKKRLPKRSANLGDMDFGTRMKRVIACFCVLLTAPGLAACGKGAQVPQPEPSAALQTTLELPTEIPDDDTLDTSNMKKQSTILVAYFSASGVTKKLAEKLAAAVDADLFEIRPKIPYTKADLNWMDKQSRSTIEMQNPSSRPEIAEGGPDLSGYDTIFVGFPIWWYIAPTIVNTFLESCDLTGKTVVPFATSGGSGMGSTNKALAPSCKGAKLLEGKVFKLSASADALRTWAESCK